MKRKIFIVLFLLLVAMILAIGYCKVIGISSYSTWYDDCEFHLKVVRIDYMGYTKTKQFFTQTEKQNLVSCLKQIEEKKLPITKLEEKCGCDYMWFRIKKGLLWKDYVLLGDVLIVGYKEFGNLFCTPYQLDDESKEKLRKIILDALE